VRPPGTAPTPLGSSSIPTAAKDTSAATDQARTKRPTRTTYPGRNHEYKHPGSSKAGPASGRRLVPDHRGTRVEADWAEESRSGGDEIGFKEARQAAAAHCDSLAALLESTESAVKPPEAEAHLASCHAELSRARGRSLPERWARAVELWNALDRPYASAYASYPQAEALVGRASERQQGQRALADAARLSANLSAGPLRARIETLARAARLNLSAADGATDAAPEVVGKAHPFDLTDRELQVLALMTAGLTNREIAQRLYISHKTAGVHVSHIPGKLGVPNRVMAAAVAQRLGLAPPG
jgi:DNA-binding CsgD family transcriptional regulator